MKHLCLVIACVLLLSAPASAGFFDALLGSKQDNATEQDPGPEKPGFFEMLFAKKQDNATKQDTSPLPPKPIFGGKMMNGSELLGELRTIKAAFSTPSPATMLSQLLLPQPPAPEVPVTKGKGKTKAQPVQPQAAAQTSKTAADKPDPKGQGSTSQEKTSPSTGKLAGIESLLALASSASDLVLNGLNSKLSFQAMDMLFGMLVDKPGALSSIYVEVPDASTMNPQMRKKILNLSAFLVGLKACGHIVDASQKDFDAANDSYKKIMDIRQKAAQGLADAYFKRSQAASLKQIDAVQGTMSLRPQDEAFLDQLGNAKAEDFVKDPRVQTVAVELLRQSDPATYGKYNIEFAEMKSRYNGYARGMTGAAAMVGFSAIFATQSTVFISKQGIVGGLNFLPLLQQALPECFALAPRVIKMYMSGDESLSGSFSIERGGKVEQRGLSAQKVYSSLNEAAKNTMRDELVVNGSRGLLANLHLVAPSAAAALADKVVKKETKVLLAKHFATDQSQFSFVDAQAGKCGPPKTYKNVSQGLFFHRLPEPDKACTGETSEQALMLAQRDLRNGLSDLENSDLRKLMYALNANPADASAPLTLGDTRVRIDNLGLGGLVDQQTMLEDRMNTHGTQRDYGRESSGKNRLKGKNK